MLDPIPASRVRSDSQNYQCLMISEWPGNHISTNHDVDGFWEILGTQMSRACFVVETTRSGIGFNHGGPKVSESEFEAVRNPPPHPGAARNTLEHSREHNLGSPPRGPLDLRIRPRRFPAMQDPIPALKISSDTKNVQFSMILVNC